MGDGTALLRLMTWLSPAFPTGGFAYSHGLEWSVEAGDITGEVTLTEWADDLLHHGGLWSDAILLRHAQRAAKSGRDDELRAVAALAAALTASAERRLETLAQGAAFVAAAKPWARGKLDVFGEAPVAYPVAAGALAGYLAVDEHNVLLAFLHAATANLVSAGLRLIPLGQDAGLRVQAALEPVLLVVAAATKDAGLDELGGAAWRSEIAAMKHETQYTRLFRT